MLAGGLWLAGLVVSLLVRNAVALPALMIGSATGLMVTVLTTTVTVLQVDRDPATLGSGPMFAAVLSGSLLLAGAVAAGLYRLGRPARAPLAAHPTAPPADAPRVILAEGSTAAFVQRLGLSPGLLATMALGVGIPLVLAGLLDRWMLIVVGGLLVLVVLFATATFRADASGVSVTSGARVRMFHESMQRITGAEVGEVKALGEFGGFGWRLAVDGRRGFVTRSGAALIVHREGEPDLVVTVDNPVEAAGLINALKDREAAAAV